MAVLPLVCGPAGCGKTLLAMEFLVRGITEFGEPGVFVLENPRLARRDEIVAIPTLVRQLPAPVRKIIGDLSDAERVLAGLQLRPVSA